MKRCARVAAAIIAAATLTSGCASMGRHLALEKVVVMQAIASPRAVITRVSVIQSGATVTVAGFLRSRIWRRGPIPGRLTVQVIAPDGQLVQSGLVPYTAATPLSSYAMFKMTMSAAPPRGSVIRLRHDDSG